MRLASQGWMVVAWPFLPATAAAVSARLALQPGASMMVVWGSAVAGAALGYLVLRRSWVEPANRIQAWLGEDQDGGARASLQPSSCGALEPVAHAVAASSIGRRMAFDEEIRTSLKTGEHLIKTAEDLSATLDRLSASAASVRAGERLLETDIKGVNLAAEELRTFVAKVSKLLETLAGSYASQVERLEIALGLVFSSSDEMTARREAAAELSTRSAELRVSLSARAASLERLCALSEQLRDSVTQIADLAERTQLLAINAAIESARAGAWGRGFAVVAGEIRKFSDETTLLVRSVQESFEEIADGAGKASAMVAEASSAIADVAEKTGSFATSMEAMSGKMNEAARRSREVSFELEQLSDDSRRANGDSASAVERAVSLSGIASRVLERFGESARVVESVLEDVSRLSNGVERIASIGRNQAASSRRFISGAGLDAADGRRRVGSGALRLVTAAWPPYVFEKAGAPAGIDADILAEVSRRLDRELRIEFLPWETCVDMVKSGDADGIFSLNQTEEREAFLAYPEEHNFDSASVLFARRDDPVVFRSFEDLAGKRIGVIEGYSYSGGLMDAQGIIHEPASSDETNLKRLVSGAIDLAVADKLVGLDLARGLGIRDAIEPLPKELNSTRTYLAFSLAAGEEEARRRAAAYGAALAAMKRDGTWQRIMSAYL